MILSGNKIRDEINNGNISIIPFNENQLNPNSYNLRLGDELLVYTGDILDMRKDNQTKRIKIPKMGYVLKPGELYLGKTMEYTETHKFLPCLEGRSSIGRLGIKIHVTAGFGDVGFKGNWTLEIECTKPVVIYPGIEICQIYYQEVRGEVEEYHGKYQGQTDIHPSRMFKDFK